MISYEAQGGTPAVRAQSWRFGGIAPRGEWGRSFSHSWQEAAPVVPCFPASPYMELAMPGFG